MMWIHPWFILIIGQSQSQSQSQLSSRIGSNIGQIEILSSPMDRARDFGATVRISDQTTRNKETGAKMERRVFCTCVTRASREGRRQSTRSCREQPSSACFSRAPLIVTRRPDSRVYRTRPILGQIALSKPSHSAPDTCSGIHL